MTMILDRLLRKAGWTRIPVSADERGDTESAAIPDLTETERRILQQVRPFTMTSPDRLITLIRAVEYTVREGLDGEIVECGVWRGGSMMAAALTLLELGVRDRRLHLFDTYEGMPPPSPADVSVFQESAEELMRTDTRDDGVKCIADLADVVANLESTGYPMNLVSFHRGKVEETVPECAPEKVALLRLDTDWYESTKHELEHLYPRLADWGALIIDDYGHWEGARKAVDEYLARLPHPAFLHRIDYTGRALIKPGVMKEPPQ